MQTHRLCVLEAAVNVVAGLILALLLQFVLFEAMAIAASLGQSLVLIMAFSVLALIRGYVVRRLCHAFSLHDARTVPLAAEEARS